jgi:magnesium chelatase accessory protein
LALDQRLLASRIIAINGALLPLGGVAGMLFAPLARLLAGTPLLPQLVARRVASPISVSRVIKSTGSRLSGEGIDLYVRLMRSADHVAGTLAMLSQWDLESFARDLPDLPTPLTLLVGNNDKTVPPAQARDVHARVPSAAIQWLSGLGHLAHEEEPGLIAQKIRRACELRGEEREP